MSLAKIAKHHLTQQNLLQEKMRLQMPYSTLSEARNAVNAINATFNELVIVTKSLVLTKRCKI